MYSAFIFSNLRLKMIQIGDVVVSFDVLREKFLCDLNACKGACCVEGDAGAPVELDEIEKLEEVLPVIWDELSPEAHVILEKQGVVYTDCEGDLVTSIVNNKIVSLLAMMRKDVVIVLLRRLIGKARQIFINLYPAICIQLG